MRYEKVAKEDLSDSVARQLRAAIFSGAHQPGELLPPERDLAAQFGVDRHTLRSALTELEQQSLVQRRQGSGCRVLDFRRTGTLDLLKHLVVKPGTDDTDPAMVAQAVDVGRVTFQGLMDLVVDHANAADLAAMRAMLDGLAAAVDGGDARTIIGVERDFFRVVFQGAHSLVAVLLANTFDQVFDAAIDPAGRVRLQWGDEVVTSGRLDAYAQVIDAIERRDRDQARRLVDVVLTGIPGVVAAVTKTPATARRRAGRHADTG